MDADAVLELDAAQLPTGRLLPVAGTAFDFRRPRALDDEGWRAPRSGFAEPALYDHYWVRPAAHAAGTLARLASVRHAASGRSLQAWSTEPGLQVYAGPCVAPQHAGGQKRLAHGRAMAACAWSLRRYPDAPNQPNFPSARVAAGEVYAGRIEYRFGTDA